MNIRQKYELKMLSDDGHMDMSKTAELFSIHLRTVRYDIEILNEYLQKELGEGCIRVNNKIASVETADQERIRKAADLNVRDFYADRLSGEERMLLMLFDLCWSSGGSTIQNLADKYFVSRATVNKDIVALKEYCRKNGIRFVSSRGKGIHVEADETERRRYLAKIIRDLTAWKARDERPLQSAYSQWFREQDLERIRKIVIEVEEQFSIYLADIAYEGLVLHIALSIERFRTDSRYGELLQKPMASRNSVQYQMADRIVRSVNEAFGIRLPETEIHYVALHIGAKSSDAIRREAALDVPLEYYCIRLISGVGRKVGCDLSGDGRLYESLLQHMNVCVYRKKSGMLLENPLKEELIGSYPELYEVIRHMLCVELKQDLIIASDDEIAYILLHFATALYRRKQNTGRLADVAVVCATGMGTAELVVVGLQKKFRLNIVGALAEHQLENFLKKQSVDLIISTVPLKTFHSFVCVSPLLRREDIVSIGKRLLDLGFDIEKPAAASGEWSDTARWLEHLLRNYSGKGQEEVLKRKINDISKEKKLRKEEKPYMLSELLKEQSIRLNAASEDWEDAVQKSGEPLVEEGAITEVYIQAVIDSVKEAGPYIVITKGVALPHATNKEGVNHTAMSFVRLAEPVNFGNPSNDPVKYLFMLATTDANSHLGALQDLAEFLERKEFMEVLETAREPWEITAYIRANESSR